MTQTPEKSKGWYLGLPYMGASCISPTKPLKIPAERRDCKSIFIDDVILQTADWRELLKDWLEALTTGGRIILWVSDVRYIEPPAGAQRLTLSDLLTGLADTSGLSLVAMTDAAGGGLGSPNGAAPSHSVIEADIIDGHAFIVVEKTQWAEGAQRKPWRKAEKHVLVVRTGAHGDALMAASVLPGLKQEGWKVTMMTATRGHETLCLDPHIDEFLVIRDKAMPDDDELGAFWSAWSPRFDRTINLMQTVEGRFLKKSNRPDYWWPDDQRRALCGGSYLGFTHQAAQVPAPYRVKFYPSDAERAWAQQKKDQLGKCILWCLQGSAIHKWWPYAPQAVCQLLGRTDYKIVLCGDDSAQDLANAAAQAVVDYVGDATRIKSLIGIKTIREVMALAQLAEIVIGPETGILNAVCMEPNAKIVFLSHSASSNLTDDWVNTKSLVPTSPCYPCHRMHYSHTDCPQDKITSAAACAASISIASVVDAVTSVFSASREAEKIKNEVDNANVIDLKTGAA